MLVPTGLPKRDELSMDVGRCCEQLYLLKLRATLGLIKIGNRENLALDLCELDSNAIKNPLRMSAEIR